MSHYNILWIIALVLAVIGHAAIVIHILLTKHEEPVSAVAWLMAVILSPVAGLTCYLLFGINRLHNTGKKVNISANLFGSTVKRETAKKLLKELKKFILPPAAMPEVPLFHKSLNSLLPETVVTIGNQGKLLQDGSMAYPEMYKAISNAQHSIHLQSYIIMNDQVGQEMFELLAHKASQGIRIRVIYDTVGSFKSIFSHFFLRYTRRHPNLKVRAFMKFNIFMPWRIQLRNHRKLLIVDGKIAFIGGINISAGNLPQPEGIPKRRDIHDLHCRIQGPAVIELQKNFLRDWAFVTEDTSDNLIHPEDFPPPRAYGNNHIRVIDSGPGQNDAASEKAFMTAASTAQQKLIIMTPYFVPGPLFVSTLSMAVARGVEVIIIVPENNNNLIVRAASRSIYQQLIRAGVKLYEKRGIFSHIKATLIDDRWMIMGSSNCDSRSFRLNYELDFCVEEGELVAALKRQLEKELQHSRPIAQHDEELRPIYLRLLDNACSLLTPIL